MQTSVTAGKTTTATRHYTDSSDNPAWIETTRPDGTSETLRYTGSISGDLGATIATDGGVSLMLSNTHGDIVTTVPIPAGTPADSAAVGITGWATYTEYGTPLDRAQSISVGTSAGYGWLGAEERSTTLQTASLALMGVRFYNPTTGSFSSVDPIIGGNATAYTYPTEPINQSDPTGLCNACKKMRHDGGGFGGGFMGSGWKNSGTSKPGYRGNKETKKENHKSGLNVHKKYPTKSSAKRAAKSYSRRTYKGKRITVRHSQGKYNVEVWRKNGKKVRNYHLYYD